MRWTLENFVASLLESKRTELERICHHWGVRRLELFGSAARQDFGPSSDLDFLVEFTGNPSLDDYLGLREDLKSLFDRGVDLVMPKAIRNPYIRAAIARDRQLLYAA
ncbi:MAG TPA: nucleotidyltransferase family protein [Steroidobacteraceae bacterium]|nr:nucleotidyltransferase family protein [Steroidobacteraceae bacterium]